MKLELETLQSVAQKLIDNLATRQKESTDMAIKISGAIEGIRGLYDAIVEEENKGGTSGEEGSGEPDGTQAEATIVENG